MSQPSLDQIAEQTLKDALEAGADDAVVRLSHARFVDLKRRERKIETLEASESRGLTLSLYVDGRYSSNATSYLSPDALRDFTRETLAMTRVLARDPHRALPDPELYGPADAELDIHDDDYAGVEMDQRTHQVTEAEEAGLAAGDRIISVTTEITTQQSELIQLHSNGFRGTHRSTGFFLTAAVTARDDDGRRPEDSAFAGARYFSDLPPAAEIGQLAARRAIDRLGATKVPSAKTTLVVQNRAAGRLIGSLLGPLHGAAPQQRRSCFEGYLEQAIGSARLTLADDPLLPRGLASRTFDGDGLAARPRQIFDRGVLKTYFIDVYYGRKLAVPPTTGSGSNLLLELGDKDRDELLQDVGEGILVTSFLGGNANPATGDFSFGVAGFLVRDGKLDRPINEMNIADNHTELWQRLAAVGNDPHPYSSWRNPTLVFEDVQFSGS